MTDTKTPIIEHFEQARSGHRRRFTTEQKQALLADAGLPGGSISATARRHGISPSLLFRWKRMQDEGALAGLDADERVVGESEMKELKSKVRELERLLGKKTMEVEILKEVVEYSRGKGWLPPRTLPKSGGSR